MSDEVQLIKDKIDVADLIAEYVQLKPAGINKKGLCPFHHEKSPSFMVNSERQGWHCFGCGKGGDIFTFVQEMEGMEFKEALKHLANRAGVQLTSYRSDVDSSQKNRLKDINVEAARFFHNFLLKMPAAKPAMDYLINRGLKNETIEEWQVGFVPEQWDLLTQYLLKKGFSIDDLVVSGLTIKRDPSAGLGRAGSGFYDRFRGRVMFPIWNVHGEVVGFTGRILVEKENSGGKYVNTPQTLVYDKSRVIFGLNKAKQEIKAKDSVVMVEGQMDVVACHQAGMKNVVASSGTALTEEQVKLLKRYSLNLNMAFDSDDAGQNAAKRGIDIAIREGINIRVISIPVGFGKDPDECLKKNPSVWFQSVEKARGIMDWYFEKILVGKDLSLPRQKQLAADQLLPEIALIPYAVERDHWLRQLGEKLGVDVAVLREDIVRLGRREIRNKKLEMSSEGEEIVAEDDRLTKLIERLMVMALRFNDLFCEVVAGKLGDVLSTGRFGSLYTEMKREYTENNKIDMEKLRGIIESADKENLIDILLMKGELDFSGIQTNEAKNELRKLLASIMEEWQKKQRKEMQGIIEKAERDGDKTKLNELVKKFGKI
ncbi:MAG: DNA primase [Candidatus Magasanikbacteria bacterium RIFCSPLOWO2_01_FULL_43_20b]|nr:MAG: DNA primase [Candidatus Magasanikbacteria bacterium RIFCSPLOWO2_02_FULL_43_22]OGH71622.1 MAG: DNA primase [Candidatus Magasanikbacteria bacterium RIFCSPHIGHO2_02_FULL_44_13]OGH73633.1 MAG: DNA primase [Candidatus Magasanikbacteria bacterium RIFCSPLOWO2_01_FULL_43_20b]